MADEGGEPVYDDGDDGRGENGQQALDGFEGHDQSLEVGGPQESEGQDNTGDVPNPDADAGETHRPRGDRQSAPASNSANNQARFQKVCPSVLKGEPCWALSRGKPCNYANHTLPEERQGNLYVSHLPLDMTKHDFEALFRPFGPFKDTRFLVHPKTGEPTGVGFVHFHKPKDALKAIEVVNGMRLPGSERPLQCRIAERRAKSGGPVRGRRPPGIDRGPRRGGYYDEYSAPSRTPYYPDRDYDYYGPARRPPPPRGYHPYDRSPPPTFDRSPPRPRRDFADVPPPRPDYPPFGLPPRRPQGSVYSYAPGPTPSPAGYDPYH